MTAQRRRTKKLMEDSLTYFVIGIILLFFLFPIFWEVFTSFKPVKEITSVHPLSLAFKPTLENWRYLIKNNFFHSFRNSVIVVLCTTAITLIIGSLAAYSFVWFKFRGRKAVTFGILALRMLPPVSFIVPLFLLIKRLGLTNTFFSLILLYIMFNLPFTIWLLIGYFRGIPREISEAALVDGCTPNSVFWRIVLPLAKPGMIAVTIFCTMWSWSEYLYALVITSEETQTLPVAAAGVLTHYFTEWGGLASVSVFIISLPLIFAIFVQKHLIRGITLGAIK